MVMKPARGPSPLPWKAVRDPETAAHNRQHGLPGPDEFLILSGPDDQRTIVATLNGYAFESALVPGCGGSPEANAALVVRATAFWEFVRSAAGAGDEHAAALVAAFEALP